MYIVINGTVVWKLHHIMKQVGLDSLKNKTKLSAEIHEMLLSGVSTLHIGQPEKRLLPLLHTVNPSVWKNLPNVILFLIWIANLWRCQIRHLHTSHPGFFKSSCYASHAVLRHLYEHTFVTS